MPLSLGVLYLSAFSYVHLIVFDSYVRTWIIKFNSIQTFDDSLTVTSSF